ncbi:MAG TPA: hypothetical protein VNE83_00250 [Terriglobales bacterium]|nr:hypothetical protein [Terriglobales bacterium]
MQPNPGQPPAANLNSIPQHAQPQRLRRWGGVAGLVVVAIFTTIWLRDRPPAIVRMTPPGQTLLYLNLQPLRRAGWLQSAAIAPASAPGDAASYAAFITGSGFDFTRDLDAVACSLRGAPLHPAGTTCVLAGHFGPRFTAWLAAHALHRIALPRGGAAYQFPGWAQPTRPLYVFLADATHLVATNAADPAALAARAPQTPSLWQRARSSRSPWSSLATWLWRTPPVGYLAVNTLDLAAARQLDGTRPPWRGAQSIEARINLSAASGLTLNGVEQTTSPANAAAARNWLEPALAALAQSLPPDAGGKLSLRDVLDRLQVRQTGAQLTLTLQLEPGLIASLNWAQAAP